MADHATFYAEGPNVVMQDGPWAVRISQQDADELLVIYERINAIKAHTSLYDACQRAGFIPTCSPIRPGPRLVSDNALLTSHDRVKGMFEAAVEILTPPNGAAR